METMPLGNAFLTVDPCRGQETRPTALEPTDCAVLTPRSVALHVAICRTPLSQPGKPVRLPRETYLSRKGVLQKVGLFEEVGTADPRTQ